MKYACLYSPPPEINSKWWREWGKEPKRERKEARRASFWKSDCSPICGPEIEKPWNTAAMRRMAGRVGWGPWGEHRANSCWRRWLQSWEKLWEDARGKLDEWLRPGGNQLDDWLEIPLAQGRIRTPTSVQNSDTRHLFPGVGQLCRSKDKKGYGSSVSDNTPREVGGVETSNYHPASALCRTLLILNISPELTMCLSAVKAHYVSNSPTGRGVHQSCIFSLC